VRSKEREDLVKAIEDTKVKGGQYAESVRNEMAARIEKQVQMIEALLEDKRNLQDSIEQITEKAKEMAIQSEKQKKVLEDRL